MTFAWEHRNLRLFDHPYNMSITNERAVEIPIAREFVATCTGPGLEVGNVLAHYGIVTAPRHIVDKYEVAPDVDNLDIFEIVTDNSKWDWIVSVSTIEHIRQGDDGNNPRASIAALEFLGGLLSDRGRMLVTVGLGQNRTLDQYLLDGRARERTRWMYARERSADPADNTWEPIAAHELRYDARPYGPTHGANAVWIGEW